MLWMIINIGLTIAGCMLVINLAYANQYGTKIYLRPYAQGFLLLWSFATCFFWMLETFISSLYQNIIFHQSYTCSIITEIVLSLFFTTMTCMQLFQWDLSLYDITAIWYVAIFTLFYLFMAIRSCQRPTIDDDDDDNEKIIKNIDVTIPESDDDNGDDDNDGLIVINQTSSPQTTTAETISHHHHDVETSMTVTTELLLEQQQQQHHQQQQQQQAEMTTITPISSKKKKIITTARRKMFKRVNKWWSQIRSTRKRYG